MKCLKVDIKTGKKSITNVDQKTLDSIEQAKQINDSNQKNLNDLYTSIKNKLIILGFTKDECKHIIH